MVIGRYSHAEVREGCDAHVFNLHITRDLASFWRAGYFDVKKDLKGRYPKHYWPDDPLVAEATARAKPRR